MNKDTIKQAVRSTLKEHMTPKDPVDQLVEEAKDAFKGMNSVLLENAAVNPVLLKNLDKTKTMYLEKGDHRVMVFSNNKQHEVFDIATGERKQLNSRGELVTYIRDMKSDGFRPVRNKGAIAKFLTKSVRAIASYIRKYGLVTLVGVAVAAAVIYFVGPMAVPFLGNVAMKLGLGNMVGGGAEVEVVGDGWVEAAPVPVEDIPDVGGFESPALTTADVQSTLSDVNAKISGLSTAIPSLVDRGEYELAAQYGRELESLDGQKAGFEQLLNDIQAAEKAAVSNAADAAVQVAATNAAAREAYLSLLRDPNTPKDMIPVYADAVRKLSQ